VAWKLIDPIGNEFTGKITKLTLSELRSLGSDWFPWNTYMQP